MHLLNTQYSPGIICQQSQNVNGTDACDLELPRTIYGVWK
jgi:hypothetical protein